jgi:hypothetical protein
MAVPNIFGTATAAIPLSQLDQNFATAITIGNTAVYLGNTTTSLGNVTLTNVTISSGTSNITTNVATVTGTLPEANGGTGTTTGYYGFKNRIINGAMVIDQRNAGASVTPTSSAYTLDRWSLVITQASKLSAQQNAGSVTPPVGFKNYLGATSLSAYSVSASDYFLLYQGIEGFNVADLQWGTANARTVTLSFQVYSSLTGTFGGSLVNAGFNRSYPFTYTVSSANTWTSISVTIAGDTSGTWATDNTQGIRLYFGLGVGSTNSGTAGAWAGAQYLSATGATSVVGTNGATFYITGVQLEKGSTATSFDYRPFGTELVLCQRYALKYNTDAIVYAFIGAGYATTTTNANISLPLPVQMRSAPTVTASTLMVQDGTTITAVTATAIVSNQTNSLNAFVQATVASGLTAFRPYQLQTNNSTSGNLLLSAEL